MDLFRQKTAPIREKRVQAISAYFGNAKTLLDEFDEENVNQRVRTFSQDTFSDILYALKLINTIQDIGVVVHGPAGCAAGRLYFDLVYDDSVKWAVTNLDERDSILGSDVKLAKTIRDLHKNYHPKAIFVVTTPVVAINNDDVESVVEDLKEELGIPVIPVYSDGFRSKIGVTGYDVVTQSLVKHFLPKHHSGILTDSVNLLSFSENKQDVDELKRLLHKLGLEVNSFPGFSSVTDINKTVRAKISVSIAPDEAGYAGELLEEKYGSKYIQGPVPVGIKNTSQWLTLIAAATGVSELANQLIISETQTSISELEGKIFKGEKVFINLKPSYAFAVMELAKETGLQVIGIKVPYIDSHHLTDLRKINSDYPELPILVGDGQVFEETNLLRKIKPDLYIGGQFDNITAGKLGIPAINAHSFPILGFAGVKNFIQIAHRKLSNPSFSRYIAESESQSYTENWLQKKTNWFIKQEVK